MAMKKFTGVFIFLVMVAVVIAVIVGNSDTRDSRKYMEVIQSDVFHKLQLANQAVVEAGNYLSQMQFESASERIEMAKQQSIQARSALDTLSPPEKLATFHSLLEQTFDAHEEAMDLYETGIAEKNISDLQQGVARYQEVEALVTQATAELKRVSAN
ncbi:MAG: hypothetical protein COV70_03725 [Parcubacteria group bacterium CG11_big_fil_rev_8_21_14_0_20_39_22]|nr:MAG: hypothetical protein COV70_03725 [Parcubacteria group bacterium CG11_big_fil_rev_8_21_14_0_20_39_22]